MIIKALLIVAALGFGLLVLREQVPGHRLALRRIAGIVGIAAGIVAVLWPDLTTTVANRVGVGRGTDLLLYVLVMVFAYAAVATAQRIHRLEHSVTVLTRELALSRPLTPDERPCRTGRPGVDRGPERLMPGSPDRSGVPTARRAFGVFLAATLLVQLGWILILPAFRGIDEFSHAFKADAVSHGQLGTSGTPADGRGALLEVSRDVVEAASSLCASYRYMLPDDCHAVEKLPRDRVTIASGAATYNPTYYAVAGLLARPFTGATTDFAMRAVTAVIAALLLAWAAALTAGWSRNRWPLVCLGLATTPVLLYSSTIASPNGIGYAAATLLWAAGLGLVQAPGRPRLAAMATAAVVIVSTHTTG